MALIWAEDFTGERALAPLWRDYFLASARAAKSLGEEEIGPAVIKARAAEQKYKSTVDEANRALAQIADEGKARSHVFIVGVGNYDASGVNPLSTSVHGARAFVEWMLTRFAMPDRPLGSVELLSSPAPGQSEWTPSDAAAAQLG